MVRPTREYTFIKMAELLAARTTCIRRGVGCVLTDMYGKVLSTGYNGVASGMPHCNESQIKVLKHGEWEHYPNACEGADSPSGTNLHQCLAIHAEQNALLQCPDVRDICYAYVTCSPCMHCMKLLMNTGCRIIYYLEEYDAAALNLWNNRGPGYGTFKLNLRNDGTFIAEGRMGT
ncbi:MAG TPA: deaminase [Vitreimonas sp.]|nr:deaminase [Vitreimonas sp.]